MKKIQKEPQLAKQVAKYIEGHLLKSSKPGTKLPSVRKLADQLGVSVPIILSAEAILEKEGSVRIEHGKGVFVNEQNTHWQIGILSELDLLDPRIGQYFRMLAGEIKTQLMARGAAPKLYVGNRIPGLKGITDDPTCPGFWTDVKAGLLDGAIILNVPETDSWGERLKNSPIPLVGSSTELEVKNDTAAMIEEAVKQLKQQGCKRLGFIGPRIKDKFLQAIEANTLKTHDNWIQAPIEASVRGSGTKAFHAIWDGPARPDGLLIFDDMLFIDAQLAILERGVKVPQDLRLAVQVTEGAIPSSPFPFTALALSVTRKAILTVNLLLSRLRGETLIRPYTDNTFQTIQVKAEGN